MKSINIGIPEFDKLTYCQKTNYLIDVQGYSESDFEGWGEIHINNLFDNSEMIKECIDFNN